ncbi:hypothetical protein PIROE2DRAFT_16050, partial [Piromyces sp. E2]
MKIRKKIVNSDINCILIIIFRNDFKINNRDEEKPKKTKDRKGKKSFKDKERKSRGKPTYEPSALSGPFAQGAARPGVKKEYGSSRSFSGVSSSSGGGIRVEEDTRSEIKSNNESLKFKNLGDESEEDFYEEDENATRPVSLVDLTQELNEKMEKIKLEEKNFTFKRIKFENEVVVKSEDNKEKIQK